MVTVPPSMATTAPCLLVVLLCAQAFATSQSPHIVYVVADDLGWNDIGYRGNTTDVQTPKLDELAASGCRLEQFYAQQVCSPSRAAILTGKFPYRLGLSHGFIAAGAPYGLPLEERTMAQQLRDVGYATHIVGKWHLGMASWGYTPTYRGFESHFGFYNGAVHYWAHTHPEADASSPLDFRSGVGERSRAAVVNDRNGTASHNMSDYGPFVYARETVRLIDDHAARRDERPLFLFLTHQSTHEPIDAPASYVSHFADTIADHERRTFAGMVLALDDAVGTVVDAMKRNGFWENTLFVFHSDNGGNLGAGGNNFPLRGGKYSLFEGGTRVNAFVSGPVLPKPARGTVSTRLMHQVDWLPTFLTLAGAQGKTAGAIDGVNQWAAISSPSAPAARQGFIYNIDPCAYNSQNYSNFSAIRMGDFKYIDAFSSPANEWRPLPAESGARGRAAGQGDDGAGLDDNGPWLFNVILDPSERTNLVASNPDKAAELKAALDAAAHQTRRPFNCKGEPGANKVPVNITCPGNVWTPWAE